MSNSIEVFMPQCHSDAVFEAAQCNRLGKCRCVDTEFGTALREGDDCNVTAGTVMEKHPDHYLIKTAEGDVVSLARTRSRHEGEDYALGSSINVAVGSAADTHTPPSDSPTSLAHDPLVYFCVGVGSILAAGVGFMVYGSRASLRRAQLDDSDIATHLDDTASHLTLELDEAA